MFWLYLYMKIILKPIMFNIGLGWVIRVWVGLEVDATADFMDDFNDNVASEKTWIVFLFIYLLKREKLN